MRVRVCSFIAVLSLLLCAFPQQSLGERSIVLFPFPAPGTNPQKSISEIIEQAADIEETDPIAAIHLYIDALAIPRGSSLAVRDKPLLLESRLKPESLTDEQKDKLARVLMTYALRMNAFGERNWAEAGFKRAIKLLKTMRVPDSLSLAEAEVGLGRFYANYRNFDEAETLLNDALPYYRANANVQTDVLKLLLRTYITVFKGQERWAAARLARIEYRNCSRTRGLSEKSDVSLIHPSHLPLEINPSKVSRI